MQSYPVNIRSRQGHTRQTTQGEQVVEGVKRSLKASLLIVLVWLSGMASANPMNEAGKIIFAHGTVAIVDQHDSARGAQKGSVFHEGDRIVTGSQSIAQLRMNDGALASLRSHTNYLVERQRNDEDEGIYEQAGRLISGWMRSVTGAIGAREPGNVSHNTPVATIGIRGTMYQSIHVPEQGLPEFANLQPGSYIYLEEGGVRVGNESGSLNLRPGEIAFVQDSETAPVLTDGLIRLFRSHPLNPESEGDGKKGPPAGEGSGDGWIDNLRERFETPLREPRFPEADREPGFDGIEDTGSAG